MADLVSDLLQSYEFLQARLEESVVCFTAYADKIAKKDIWFNLDTTNMKDICLEDAKEAWTPIQHLLLISSTDAPPLMSIRQTLMPYEKLLRVLGAKSVYYPTIEPPEKRSYQSLSATLGEMKNKGEMVDIVFISAIFSGRWSDNGEIILDEITSHTLFVLISSAYEEPIDWEEMTVNPEKLPQDLDANDKKLDLLINLHKGTDYWGMLALANQVEKKIVEQLRLFIRLDNAREYQEMAANSNAVVFEQACKRFCEKNEAALRGWEETVAALQSMDHDSSKTIVTSTRS
ncbi:hypothetical protein EYC80_001513 [Monilinia laxa]|uniref:Uncharacterized protein n=1 Tax=Monilinia laxa TaxID=61186 RepID=A0A5N6K597_MONLA|nr:hypothetical protein EYC80_001513 [Monilinia laxa]